MPKRRSSSDKYRGARCHGVISFLNKQETQLSLTNRATHLCKCNGVADLRKPAASHVCYHAEFGRSVR